MNNYVDIETAWRHVLKDELDDFQTIVKNGQIAPNDAKTIVDLAHRALSYGSLESLQILYTYFSPPTPEVRERMLEILVSCAKSAPIHPTFAQEFSDLLKKADPSTRQTWLSDALSQYLQNGNDPLVIHTFVNAGAQLPQHPPSAEERILFHLEELREQVRELTERVEKLETQKPQRKRRGPGKDPSA